MTTASASPGLVDPNSLKMATHESHGLRMLADYWNIREPTMDRAFVLRLICIAVFASTASAQQPAVSPGQAATASADAADRDAAKAHAADRDAAKAHAADLAGMAREASVQAETRKGVTVYCREDATLGTRFTSKKCYNEQQLVELTREREAVHEQMSKPRVCAGAGCAGH